MPYSSIEGKQWAADWFVGKPIEIVVDIGPGAGAWCDRLRPVFPDSHWIGVEVWGPYVKQFGLKQKYDEVIVADARYVWWDLFGFPDLVVFGDVLEHMSKIEAQALVEKACSQSKYVLISLPIVCYPQGAEGGNPYEEHVADYRPDTVLETLIDFDLLLASHLGDTVGTYILKGYDQ